jgi:hypothetical protein
MFLGDFHIHSNFSDGRLSIPEIVDAFGSRGFGAIAITDHVCDPEKGLGKASAYLGCSLTEATFPLYREILRTETERAWDQYGMRLISGIELTKNSLFNHRSAHVLALGVHELIFPTGDCTEWIEKIHAAGGIAIAAHPVWTRKAEAQTYHLWDRRDELRNKFDAWEVASGSVLFDEVHEERVPVIANSDFHKPTHMTSWKTSLTCERHPGAILEAIRKQEIGIQFYEEKAPVTNHNWNSVSHLGDWTWGDSLGNLVRA